MQIIGHKQLILDTKNGLSSSEVAATIPIAEDGQVGRKYIVLRGHFTLNSNGKEGVFTGYV